MLSRLLLLGTGLCLAVHGASVVDQEAESNRDEKLLPVIQIVTFDNGPCTTTSGDTGSCYSQKECNALGGTQSGTCANGFGVCCVVTATCSGTISVNNTHFINPGYPSTYSTPGSCRVTLEPPSGTCQVLLTFEAFDILGPIAGDCNNDTFVFQGSNNDLALPTLCGMNAGQHMYADIDSSAGPYSLVFTLSAVSYARSWKIGVSFIEVGNPCKAPNRCLQYHKESSGAISSFNYGSSFPIMLNNLNYAICFAYIPNFCDVGITFSRFDFGNINGQCVNDYVASGGMQLCGDLASQAFSVNCTAGPTVLYVYSDSNNDNLEEGFTGSYTFMGV